MADNAALGLLTATTVPEEIWRVLEHWHSSRKISFTSAFPRERVDGPTIVWKLISRLPGKELVETRKPRLRTQIKNNTNITDYLAQWMTITYQFDVLDVSAEAVNILAEDWDSAVLSTIPFLKEKGVENFYFTQQLQDDTLQWVRQDELQVRSFRYMCILPYYYVNTKKAIRDILIRTNSDPQSETVAITRGSGTYDEYPELNVDIIYTVYQPLTEGDKKIFAKGIDYRIQPQQDGSCQLLWLQYGAQPAEGETYYVDATRFTMSEMKSSLGDTELPMP